MPRSLLAASAAVLLAAAPRAALAQSGAPGGEAPVCLGFSFGAWTPALDWKGVGHAGEPRAAAQDTAPRGRDWASDDHGTASDTTMMLFPRWWPAGVLVRLPTRAPAPGDTVAGRALALVPDGHRTSPSARVRAWRVSCQGGGS